MMHSFFREGVLSGAYSSERERYERIFLERRADNQRGHKPRPQMVTAPAERVIPAKPTQELDDVAALEAVANSAQASRVVRNLVAEGLGAPKRRYRRGKP
jgi:hypothetical protein